MILSRVCDHLAALDLLYAQARDIDRSAAAWHGGLFFLLVGLQTAHTPAQAAGQDFDLLAQIQAAIGQRAGDDGAKAGDAEDAVHGQARTAQVGTRRGFFEQQAKGREEFRKTGF